MCMTKTRALAATLSLAAVGFASISFEAVAPAAYASPFAAAQCNPEFNFECPVMFASGERLRVLHNKTPLRTCARTSCAVKVYMPATKSLKPGGGWVTSEKKQSSGNAWCYIEYRTIKGWTGCSGL
jgi:hypothetical protein